MLLFLLPLLGSCLSIETEIVFDSEDSGTVTFRYLMDREYVAEGAVDGPSGIYPLPVREEELSRRARSIDNVTLEHYRTGRHEGHEEVEARFRFESIEALNLIYGSLAEDSSISFEEGTYRQLVSRPLEGEIDEFGESFLVMLLEDERLSLSVELTGSIVSSSHGEIQSANRAQFILTLDDLLELDDEIVWTIETE